MATTTSTMLSSLSSMTELSRRKTETLATCLSHLDRTTNDAVQHCATLARRAAQLDQLTSPASDASSTLSRANANLSATLVLLKDAREKFDTLSDCEPAIERVVLGVQELQLKKDVKLAASFKKSTRIQLTEQDIYAAGDALEIVRDAHAFLSNTQWRSTGTNLSGLETLHQRGVDALCSLVTTHLQAGGPAVRPKRTKTVAVDETARQTRQRLASALQNRDLLKSIGEYEEFQPIEARPLREIRSILDCLGAQGYHLKTRAGATTTTPGLANVLDLQANQILRTDKVGSGCYNNLTRTTLQTGFAHLDSYGSARKDIAFAAMDGYYRRCKAERKKRMENNSNNDGAAAADQVNEADVAARDAVRCLEHAMVVVAGEKSVYKNVVVPAVAALDKDDQHDHDLLLLRKGSLAAYAYVAAAVVDRALDVIETVFLKEGGIGHTSGAAAMAAAGKESVLSVPEASAAAAAGLRMLDGVRMLGPSLAKLCEMSDSSSSSKGNGTQALPPVTDPHASLAAILCIALHRTTVKNAARTLENLAKAIQDDPLKGPLHRPKDASVSSVSVDVVKAIRLVSPFVSAYKSVSKRRSLPWDPNMGEEAGELDSFVRFLVMRLLNSLKGKALNYTKDGRDDSQARSNLFMMNNAFYLLEELGPDAMMAQEKDAEIYRIESSWFSDKINKIMESEKSKYLAHWESLTTHLTAVGSGDIEYQKNDSHVLSLESGRLIKQRFSGFNEDFERTYDLHKKLCVIDPRLRLQIHQDVASVFLPRYRRFYDKYTKVRFSKKHQEEYTKYSPDKIEDMLSDLYVDPEEKKF